MKRAVLIFLPSPNCMYQIRSKSYQIDPIQRLFKSYTLNRNHIPEENNQNQHLKMNLWKPLSRHNVNFPEDIFNFLGGYLCLPRR